LRALPVLTAVSEQTKAMAHLDLRPNDNKDSNSQCVKEVERVKKTTDVINHQMINPFRYEEQELINISTGHRAASIDLMRACEKDWKHWLQQEKQKVTK